MKRFVFGVVQKTDALVLLRLSDGDGKMIGQRELRTEVVRRFAEEIETTYHAYAPELRQLGRRLYDWLDGSTERWLTSLINNAGAEGCALYIDVAEHLRHLPWELLATRNDYLCGSAVRLFTPIRYVAEERRVLGRANRPLRVLFMASSPENLHPVLNFEAEEREILERVRRQQIEFVVVETGSLSGLQQTLESYESGHFDVIHLSGHTEMRDNQPQFLMENDFGQMLPVTGAEIARAVAPHASPLVFLSSCRTGQAPDSGTLPSLCEALVQAGVPIVLGWALPVYDTTATIAAGTLYRELALGKRVDESVARARQGMLEGDYPDWHYLRLYANGTPLSELVTTPTTVGRERLHVRTADAEFLDAGAKVEVCPRTRFVGRRRALQRCLRVLRSVEGEESYSEGVLLHGMAGLGKSSLAARLCERMPDHRRIVLVGAISEAEFARTLDERLGDLGSLEILYDNRLDLKQRLRRLFQSLLRVQSVLFVFDDFEQNLEFNAAGQHVVKPEALLVLTTLLHAIRDTGSDSRVIVTSVYQFPLPHPIQLHEEGMESLRGADLTKLVDHMKNLKNAERIDRQLIERVIEVAAGNPRLMSWLDKTLVEPSLDQAAALTLVEAVVDRFRDETHLATLLGIVSGQGRRLLALLSIFQIPVDRSTAIEIAGYNLVDSFLDQLVALGLIERSRDVRSGEARHFVSLLLHPMLVREMSPEEYRLTCRTAARYLFDRWHETQDDIDMLSEIHRLSLPGQEQRVGAAACNMLSNYMMSRAQVRQAERICRQTIECLGDDYRVLHNLARAQVVLGETTLARQNYEVALRVSPNNNGGGSGSMVTANERGAIIHNLAALVAQQGDMLRAHELWQESLTLQEQVGDLRGKASTLHNLAVAHANQGDVKLALELLQQVLVLREQLDDCQGKAATLFYMANIVAQQGDTQRALGLLNQSLSNYKQSEDTKGEAAVISMIANLSAQQGDIQRAVDLWQQSLLLLQQIGDVGGKAGTLHNMACHYLQQGEVARALSLLNESLTIKEQIGDVKGKAATLSMMAGVAAQQGDLERALGLWQRALTIYEQLGDVHGKATTLSMMASVIAQQGNTQYAFELWQQSLDLKEQIGDLKGKAATLSSMANVTAQKGDHQRAGELWEQALTLFEQVGDVRSRAATLANLARHSTDDARSYKLNLEAAQAFAALQAWPDLVTVLDNMGDVATSNRDAIFAQAYWLALHVVVPIDQSLSLAAKLVSHMERQLAPLVAASTSVLVHAHAADHPSEDALLHFCVDLLVSSAEALGVTEDRFPSWYESEGLNTPAQFMLRLERALVALVGEQWMFDRNVLNSLLPQ